MIKPNELRIGDLITYKSAADTDEIMEVTVGDLFRIEEDPEGYDGIPLTPEWLERLGFVKKEAKIIGGEKYCLGKFIIVDLDNKFYFVCTDSVQIKYIHQLQNLFFALTGEELKIKDHA